MRVLVSDTSVLIDLERGGLLEAAFELPYELVVPDLLFEKELARDIGDDLVHLGLRVEALDGIGITRAQTFRSQEPRLSVADSFALALATGGHDWILLSGDGALRTLALEARVECHGVLWVCDELLLHAISSARSLHAGLTKIFAHPRCRLPVNEVRKRLRAWS